MIRKKTTTKKDSTAAKSTAKTSDTAVKPAKPRYAVMLTPNGKVLIPLRDIPPEQRRGFGIPKIEGRILDMRAVLK